MAITYGFYNAVDEYDEEHKYDAEDVSSVFDGFIIDGIHEFYKDGKFDIIPANGLSIRIMPGRAWFNNSWILLNTPIEISLESSEFISTTVYPVLVFDSDERRNYIDVVSDYDPSYQHPLAKIIIQENTTQITSDMIIDMRGSSDCPYASVMTDAYWNMINEMVKADFIEDFDSYVGESNKDGLILGGDVREESINGEDVSVLNMSPILHNEINYNEKTQNIKPYSDYLLNIELNSILPQKYQNEDLYNKYDVYGVVTENVTINDETYTYFIGCDESSNVITAESGNLIAIVHATCSNDAFAIMPGLYLGTSYNNKIVLGIRSDTQYTKRTVGPDSRYLQFAHRGNVGKEIDGFLSVWAKNITSDSINTISMNADAIKTKPLSDYTRSLPNNKALDYVPNVSDVLYFTETPYIDIQGTFYNNDSESSQLKAINLDDSEICFDINYIKGSSNYSKHFTLDSTSDTSYPYTKRRLSKIEEGLYEIITTLDTNDYGVYGIKLYNDEDHYEYHTISSIGIPVGGEYDLIHVPSEVRRFDKPSIDEYDVANERTVLRVDGTYSNCKLTYHRHDDLTPANPATAANSTQIQHIIIRKIG